MLKPKHLVIIAGEESGDMHAAELVLQLKKIYPTLIISGIGGRHMQEAGVSLVANLAQFGVTGFSEVFRHFKVIHRAFKAIKQHLREQKPDLVILVDYPGFNLRLAKFAKQQLGLRIIYYISPQIWAWKAKRIHLIKRCVDKMAVILPFEKKIYEQAGVPVSFVGHPLVDKINQAVQSAPTREALNLPQDAHLIALLPGSRRNEIEQHMPVLRDTARLLYQRNPKMHFVLPVAGTINIERIAMYFKDLPIPITLIEGNALACMHLADFVLVASGTASLECALLQKPMCIIYKSSFLTYYLAMKVLRVRFLGLCNLLTGTMTVPEFLHDDCNATELSRYVYDFINNPEQPQKMIARLSSMKQSMSLNQSDCSLLELVVSQLSAINA